MFVFQLSASFSSLLFSGSRVTSHLLLDAYDDQVEERITVNRVVCALGAVHNVAGMSAALSMNMLSVEQWLATKWVRDYERRSIRMGLTLLAVVVRLRWRKCIQILLLIIINSFFWFFHLFQAHAHPVFSWSSRSHWACCSTSTFCLPTASTCTGPCKAASSSSCTGSCRRCSSPSGCAPALCALWYVAFLCSHSATLGEMFDQCTYTNRRAEQSSCELALVSSFCTTSKSTTAAEKWSA